MTKQFTHTATVVTQSPAGVKQATVPVRMAASVMVDAKGRVFSAASGVNMKGGRKNPGVFVDMATVAPVAA